MAKKKIDGIKFNMHDDRMFDFLGKFHCADIDNIRKYAKEGKKSIAKSRINMFIDKGYIQKDKIKIQKKVVQVYYLTEKGEKYIRGIHRNTTCKAYKSTSKRHDYMQMKWVMDNYDVEEIRSYYKSEYELEKGKDSTESRTDGAFIYDDNRQNVYIETITQHYKDDMKLAKSSYANNRGGQYVPIKVTI